MSSAKLMFYNKLKLQQKKINSELRLIRTHLARLTKCQQEPKIEQGLGEQASAYLAVLKLIANKKILLPRKQEQAQQFVSSLLNMFFQSLMLPVENEEEDPALDSNKLIGIALRYVTEQHDIPYDEELLPDPMDDPISNIYCNENLDDSSNSVGEETFCISSKDKDGCDKENDKIASEEVDSIYQSCVTVSYRANKSNQESPQKNSSNSDSFDLMDSSLLPETPSRRSFSRPVYWDPSTAAKELEQMSNDNITINQFDFEPRMSFASSTPAVAPKRRIGQPRVSPLGPDQATASPASSTQSHSPEQPTVIAVTPTSQVSRAEERRKRMDALRPDHSESLDATLVPATSPKSVVKSNIGEKTENFDEPRPGGRSKKNASKSRARSTKVRPMDDTNDTGLTRTNISSTLNLTSRSSSTRYSLRSRPSVNYKS